ncbi:MAG TPA: hypothetical protein VMV69_10195 [Pirellulales bacterium]|nr:hypothetical protein [Pirellulales bacterium]
MLGRIPSCWMLPTLLVGLAMGALAPHSPLHAVATDRSENFAMATGALDDVTEAVYFIDFTTGELHAAVISPVTRRFNAFFRANVQGDLGIVAAKNPKYLLVTGTSMFRPNAGPLQPATSVIYVAELTSGKLAAYNVPWSQSFAQSGAPIRKAMTRLDVIPFRIPEVASR